MYSILFVCHGNICRSPMAEFVFRAILKAKGAAEGYYVESAAVSSEELGNPIYPPARQCLRQHGVWFDPGKTARRITQADYDRFDLIIYMDRSNRRWLDNLYPSDPGGKIVSMMSFAGQNRDVADPWYTDDFETTFQDLLTACLALYEKIEQTNSNLQ